MLLSTFRTRGWSVPPWPCTDARTIGPTASPDDRGLLLRWNGMSEDERDKYTNRVLPVLEAFLDY